MSPTLRVAPRNSVILVSDFDGGEVPRTMSGSIVSATSTCVAIGCRAEDDGDTEIALISLSEVERSDPPVFDGKIRTPTGRLAVRTVLGETLLEVGVSREVAAVRVWVNDGSEPDEVVIGVE